MFMNNQSTTARVALKWGAFLGLVFMLTTLVMYLTDQATNGWFSLITIGALIAFLVLAMRDFKTTNGGYMTFGEGLGMGALLSAVAGLLSASFVAFYNAVIDPTIQQRALEKMRDQWEEQGMTDDQIDQAMEFTQKFQSPGFAFIAGVFGTIILGSLLSAAIAAMLRRNKLNPF